MLFIYCVNGGEQTRRNTAGPDPIGALGILVSFPSPLPPLFFFPLKSQQVMVNSQEGMNVLPPAVAEFLTAFADARSLLAIWLFLIGIDSIFF